MPQQNHGIYVDTHWRTSITFVDEDGAELDLSDREYFTLRVFNKEDSEEVFRFQSDYVTGEGGSIDTTDKGLGVLYPEASVSDHGDLERGEYLWVLTCDDTTGDPEFLGNGIMRVGGKGGRATEFKVLGSFGGNIANALVIGISNVTRARDLKPLTFFGGRENTDITDAWNDGIASLNANEYRGFYIPRGLWHLEGTPDAITGVDWTIRGLGNMSRLTIPSTAGDAGTFFKLGTTSTPAQRGYLGDMRLICNNTPDENAYAFDLIRAVDCTFQNFTVSLLPSIVRAGGSVSGERAIRCWFNNFNGNCNKGLNADANILIQAAANLLFNNWNINGTGVSNTNPDGAIIKMVPAVTGSNGIIDTIRFLNFGIQMFSRVFDPDQEPVLLDPDGKPYGLVINPHLSHVYNIWMDNSYIDHTTVANIKYIDTDLSGEASVGKMRNHKYAQSRFTSDDGHVLDIDLPSESMVRTLSWLGCRMFGRTNDSFVDIEGNNMDSCAIEHTEFMDAVFPERTVPLVKLGADGWTFRNNRGGSDVNFHAGEIGIEITNPDIVKLYVTENWFPHVEEQIVEPTAYTTAVSATRVINSPIA